MNMQWVSLIILFAFLWFGLRRRKAEISVTAGLMRSFLNFSLLFLAAGLILRLFAV